MCMPHRRRRMLVEFKWNAPHRHPHLTRVHFNSQGGAREVYEMNFAKFVEICVWGYESNWMRLRHWVCHITTQQIYLCIQYWYRFSICFGRLDIIGHRVVCDSMDRFVLFHTNVFVCETIVKLPNMHWQKCTEKVENVVTTFVVSFIEVINSMFIIHAQAITTHSDNRSDVFATHIYRVIHVRSRTRENWKTWSSIFPPHILYLKHIKMMNCVTTTMNSQIRL